MFVLVGGMKQNMKINITKLIMLLPKYSVKIATEILSLANYVYAEDYHQDYLAKNPSGYCPVNLQEIPKGKPMVNPADYPKPSASEIKKKLSSEQYGISQGDSIGMERIEVRSRSVVSHLGHLFTEGLVEEGGLRYCLNSGALNFIGFAE